MDDDWAWKLHDSKSVTLTLPEEVSAKLNMKINSGAFNDVLDVYLNNIKIINLHLNNTCGGGYCVMNSINASYSFDLDQNNNNIKINILNSGGAFYVYNLYIKYNYEWITK